MDTDIERRSLLETNGDSSDEEESDANNERNTEITNVKSSAAAEPANDDELKEVKVLDEAGDAGEQLNQSDARLQSEPVVRHENMIQFDAEAYGKPASEELMERSRKDFLTIDLDENEFSRSYTDGCVDGVSSSLKNSELLNKLNISNISNISDILNASNASENSRNSFAPNKLSSKSANEEANSSDNSDEIEIFNKNQLDHGSHNRTIWTLYAIRIRFLLHPPHCT